MRKYYAQIHYNGLFNSTVVQFKSKKARNAFIVLELNAERVSSKYAHQKRYITEKEYYSEDIF